MKQKLVVLLIVVICCLPERGHSQIVVWDVIKQGITKVIKAVDLEVQRLQTQTIWLQNAQKVLENAMSKLHLGDIADWVQKQKELYQNYFNELWQVKEVIGTYHRVKEIVESQESLVKEYQTAFGLLRQDGNFTPQEINYMSSVYSGILEESLKNLDQLFIVINSFAVQMSDGKRMELIDRAASSLEENKRDLEQFTMQNKMLSLQRAAEKGEIDVVRKLYGLN